MERLGHVSDENWACLWSSSERKSILAFRVQEGHERRIIWWQRTSTSVGVPMITKRTSAACPVKGRDEMRRQSKWVATGWKVTTDINLQSRAKGPRRGDHGVLGVDHSSSHKIPRTFVRLPPTSFVPPLKAVRLRRGATDSGPIVHLF